MGFSQKPWNSRRENWGARCSGPSLTDPGGRGRGRDPHPLGRPWLHCPFRCPSPGPPTAPSTPAAPRPSPSAPSAGPVHLSAPRGPAAGVKLCCLNSRSRLNRALKITARPAQRPRGRVLRRREAGRSPHARPRQRRDAAARQPGSAGKGQLGPGQRGGAGTEAPRGTLCSQDSPAARSRTRGPRGREPVPTPGDPLPRAPAPPRPPPLQSPAVATRGPYSSSPRPSPPLPTAVPRRLTAGIRVAMGIGK